MGKPLLTDEIIERARRKKARQDEFGYYSPQLDDIEDIDMDEDYDDEYDDEDEYQGYQEGQTVRIPVQHSIVKSRRIETVKREEFRSKVNKILFWVLILVIIFLFAVFRL